MIKNEREIEYNIYKRNIEGDRKMKRDKKRERERERDAKSK